MNKFKKLLIMTLGVIFVVCMSASVFVACSGSGVHKLTIAEYDSALGKVDNLSGKTSFRNGEEVTIRVSPNAGYEVKSVKLNSLDVTDSVVANGNMLQFNVNRDRTISVEFQDYGEREKAKTACKVNVANENEEWGSLVCSSSKNAFPKRTKLTFTAKPNDGYELKEFTIDGVDYYDEAMANNGMVSYTVMDNVNIQVGFQTVEDYSLIEHIDADVFDQKINRRGRVLIDFWATWCGPCKQLAPHIENLALTQAKELKLKIYEVDVDKNPDIFKRYAGPGTTWGDEKGGIPFLMLFEDGRPIAGKTGYMPASSLEQFVTQKV